MKKARESVLVKKKFMRVVYKIMKWLYCIPLFIFKMIGMIMKDKSFALNFMLPFCEAAEITSDSYVTCKFRPKDAESVLETPHVNKRLAGETAIVIQGPIIEKNHFTLETIKLYHKIYPYVTVILSTWEGSNERALAEIKRLKNCIVVLNKKPERAGNLNVNYQIVSTMGGLKEAKRLGKRFVLKVRSDMRMFRGEIFQELHSLIEEYPCRAWGRLEQSYRLIVFNAYIARPCNISDFYMFGYMDDMLNFWNMPHQEQDSEIGYKVANQMEAEAWTYRKIYESRLAPEIEITRNYIERFNGNSECDIKQWWNMIQCCFITLPHSYLDVLWYKYDYNREENYIQKTYIRNIYGGERLSMATFTFGMWLDLINNEFESDCSQYENFLDESG